MAPGNSQPLDGARLLFTDFRVGYLLANETRYRALERMFGISRGEANLLTFVLLVLAANAAGEKVAGALGGFHGPTRMDALLGTVGAKELLAEVAGRPARDAPMFGALAALALAGGLSVPIVRRSMREVSSNSRRMRVVFRHRYGYLIARGRRIARARTRTGDRTSIT